MGKKFLLFVLIFGTIHFGLSMLAIFKGFYIFKAPSDAIGVFWTNAMNVLLFPANILIQGSGSQWQQTLAIVINSLLWGIVFTYFCLGLRKIR